MRETGVHMKKYSIRSTMLLLLIILLSPQALAHDVEEEHDEPQTDSMASFSPVTHWRNSNYFASIFIIVFWALALKGFIDLIILVLAKHIK